MRALFTDVLTWSLIYNLLLHVLAGIGLLAFISIIAERFFPTEELSEEVRDRILDYLVEGEMSGMEIKRRLAAEGLLRDKRRGRAPFYSLMATLEKAGVVEGYDHTYRFRELELTERIYRRLRY